MDQFLTQIKAMAHQDLKDAVDYLEQNNWSMAIVSLEKAYGRMGLLDDEELKYQILYHLMSAYLHSNYPDCNGRIEECFQEINRLKVVNYSLQAEILRLRGIALIRQGKYDEGVQVFLQLAQVSRGRMTILVWAYLSEIYLLQHQYTARKTLNLAKHYSFKILNECVQKPFLRKEKSWVLDQLGKIFFSEKNYAEALPYYREKLEMTEQPVKRYWIYLDMAEIFLALEQTSRGFQYLKEAEGFFKRQNDNPGLAQAYYVKGKYLLHEGQSEQGIGLFQDAMELFHEAEEWTRFARTIREMEQIIAKRDGGKTALQADLIMLHQAYVLEDINF